MPSNMIKVLTYLTIALLALLSIEAFAHGVDDKTRAFLEQNNGVQFIPFLYIGAKHMITGYDHLLFLVGVIFFLYRSRDVLLYVTMFTIGHSTTLLFGVKRVIVGENKNFLGAEALMCSNGVQVTVLQDQRCIELMQRLLKEKPDLWSEDIGQ